MNFIFFVKKNKINILLKLLKLIIYNIFQKFNKIELIIFHKAIVKKMIVLPLGSYYLYRSR